MTLLSYYLSLTRLRDSPQPSADPPTSTTATHVQPCNGMATRPSNTAARKNPATTHFLALLEDNGGSCLSIVGGGEEVHPRRGFQRRCTSGAR